MAARYIPRPDLGTAPPDSAVDAALAPPGYPSDLAPDDVRRLSTLGAEIGTLVAALERVRSGESALADEAPGITLAAESVDTALRGLGPHDAVQDLRLDWRRLTAISVIAAPAGTDTMRRRLAQVDTALGVLTAMRFHVATLTIPERVNKWLAEARPGYSLPFHQVFADELPEPDARRKILEMLAWAPDTVPRGLVDVRRGVVLRHHDAGSGRWISLAVIALTGALATAAAAGIAHVPDPQWPLDAADAPAALAAWLALVAGVVVHGAVDAVKRDESGALVPPVAPVDLGRYIDARLGSLLVGLVLALVVHAGFAVVAGRDYLTPINGFLLGYGLDSAVGLFTTAMDLRSGRQLADLGRLVGR